MKTPFKAVLGRAVDLAAGQGGAQALSALAFVLLARYFEPEMFGALSAYYGVAMFLSVLVEFGATSTAVRSLSRDESSALFGLTFYARVQQTLLLSVALLVVAYLIEDVRILCLIVVLAGSSALARISTAPLRAKQKTKLVGFLLLTEKACVTLFVGLAVLGDVLTTNSFFVVSALSAFFTAFVAHASWRTSGARFGCLLVQNPFAGARHIGVASTAVGLQTLDSAVMALTAGPHVAGVFAAVGRWTQPMSLVAQVVTQSAFADMSSMRSVRQAASSLRQHMIIIAVSLLPLVLIFLFANWLVSVLLGEAYTDAVPVLRILAMAVIFGTMNSPMTAFLQARSDERFASIVLIVGLPVQIFLMGVFAATSGATWSAVAVLFSQATISLILASRVRKHLQHS